jgi:hypothetical protein
MTLTRSELTQYLLTRRSGVANPAIHRRLHETAPAFHVSQLSDPSTRRVHKREILFQALLGGTSEQLLLSALWALELSEALDVVSVLRDRRRNGRRARRLGLRFLLGHPRFAELAATRRQRTIKLFKHFLGERTWSAIKRAITALDEPSDRFLARELMRHAPEGDRSEVWEALCLLAGQRCATRSPHLARRLSARANLLNGAGLPRETLLGLRGQFHKNVPLPTVATLAAPAPEPRGPGFLTALHRSALAEHTTPAAIEKLEARLDEIERTAPAIRGRAAVVLDQSLSMASSGERANYPFALAVALTRLLQARCTQVTVHGTVPGVSPVEAPSFPRPRGVGDLAKAVLAAARTSPQVIFVITDGYENRREGDVAEVVRGVRQLDLGIAVYQVVPLFSTSEDLSHRRLSDSVPLLALEHEDEVVELAAHVASQAGCACQEGRKTNRLSFFAWLSAWGGTTGFDHYYKYNLANSAYYSYFRLEQDQTRWQEMNRAYRIMVRYVGHHRNAHFDLIETSVDPSVSAVKFPGVRESMRRFQGCSSL